MFSGPQAPLGTARSPRGSLSPGLRGLVPIEGDGHLEEAPGSKQRGFFCAFTSLSEVAEPSEQPPDVKETATNHTASPRGLAESS